MEQGEQGPPPEQTTPPEPAREDHRVELIRNYGKLKVFTSMADGRDPEFLMRYYTREHLNDFTNAGEPLPDRLIAAAKLYEADVVEADDRIRQAFTMERIDEEDREMITRFREEDKEIESLPSDYERERLWQTERRSMAEENKSQSLDRLDSRLDKERRHKALSGLIQDTKDKIQKLEEEAQDERKNG